MKLPENSSKTSWHHHKATGFQNLNYPPRLDQPICSIHQLPTTNYSPKPKSSQTKLTKPLNIINFQKYPDQENENPPPSK